MKKRTLIATDASARKEVQRIFFLCVQFDEMISRRISLPMTSRRTIKIQSCMIELIA